MSQSDIHCAPDDQSTGVELTAKELLCLTDALAFSIQRSEEVHGRPFVSNLHHRLTQARERIFR